MRALCLILLLLAGCETAPAPYSDLPPPTPPVSLTAPAKSPRPLVSLPPPKWRLDWIFETNRLWRVYLTDDFSHWSFLAEVYTNRCPIPSDNPFLFFTVISVDPISGLTSNPEPLP